jgi:hypothetical protein
MPAERSNRVIDISHDNGTRIRFDKAKADGIVGVIQKATRANLISTLRPPREIYSRAVIAISLSRSEALASEYQE